jgi:hypothetical protein
MAESSMLADVRPEVTTVDCTCGTAALSVGRDSSPGRCTGVVLAPARAFGCIHKSDAALNGHVATFCIAGASMQSQ